MLSKQEYENIIIKNDKFTDETLVALGIVKKYISENELIITGGMAIDFALRLKGSKLYEDVLPDYDCYSPEYHKDAYKIAEKLHIAGLNDISVINANHISTMRVRVNYIVVADVTYIPKEIYEKLPVLLYRDIRFIHPHYQMIDQHRSLSYPYENKPWEVILHRWKKDATRYDLLYNYYSLNAKGLNDTDIKIGPEITISSIIFNRQCISGFAGLLYWLKKATDLGFKNTNLSLGTMHADSSGFIFKIPVDSHGVSIYSDDILNLRKLLTDREKMKNERQYNRFLDKLPHKFIINNTYELFDNKGYMLGAYKTETNIFIANLQNIMLYMLSNYFILKYIKGLDRGYSFYIGYITANSIISWAGKQYKKKESNDLKLFFPSADVYGDEEISDSYINAKRLFLEKLGEIPKTKLQPHIIFHDMFINHSIPDKYYKFNPLKSQILKFDGTETDTYYDRIRIIL